MFNPIGHGAANIFLLFVLHQYIGAADQLAPIYWCCKHFIKIYERMLVFLHVLVLLAQFHQYIGSTMSVAQIYWWN
jgi:hypothetical protein